MLTEKIYRETELDLRKAQDLILGRRGPPTKMTLIKRMQMNDYCCSLCRHNDDIYVGGIWKGIVKINKIDERPLSRLEIGNSEVNGMEVYKGRLYYTTAIGKLSVYELQNDQQHSSWSVSDDGGTWPGCRICFVGDELAVADRRRQGITLYSTHGEEIRHVACNSITHRGKVVICRAEQQSIIISDEPSSTVLKLNLKSGEIEWKSTCVPQPQAVTCDLPGYVLVASKSEVPTLSVLDSKTGK